MRFIRSSAALAVCAALSCALAAPSPASAEDQFCTKCNRVVINEYGALIYNAPNRQVIGWIKVGTEVYVLESPEGIWCNVLIRNGPNAVTANGGWVLCLVLGGRARIVTRNGTDMYTWPKGLVIGWIGLGTEVTVLESFEAEWCNVLVDNGRYGGWIPCTSLGSPAGSQTAHEQARKEGKRRTD